MESLSQLNQCVGGHPVHLSNVPRRPSLQSSLSFRTLSSPSPKFTTIRASSSNRVQNPRNPSPSKPLEVLTPILRSACVTLSAAAALFFIRFQVKPAIAAPVSAPLMESSNVPEVSFDEQEEAMEDLLSRCGNDVESLRTVMEVKIKSKKLQEAIQVIDRLIELEPEEIEWPLLKANLYSYSGDSELAKQMFEQILENDPLRVEAYHGLVMVGSDSGEDLKGVAQRIKSAMERCTKEKKNSNVRDFKLLIAQVSVFEGDYGEALKVYDELVKEEPRDFRPYLCQGIIYTLMRKTDEAEKKFSQYRKLVPKNHPYAEYFDENTFATNFFAQQVEKETAGSRRS